MKDRFKELYPQAIPLNEGIDVPADFDPGYTVQTVCDCGNDQWEIGEIDFGTLFNCPLGKKKINKCTTCGNAQLLISNEYLKKKKQ